MFGVGETHSPRQLELPKYTEVSRKIMVQAKQLRYTELIYWLLITNYVVLLAICLTGPNEHETHVAFADRNFNQFKVFPESCIAIRVLESINSDPFGWAPQRA